MDQLDRLRGILGGMGGCLVAYSGGVDSTFLLAAAVETLGDRWRAVTVRSLFHEEGEAEEARARAVGLGARHDIVDAEITKDDAAVLNPPDRCYLCKKSIFSILKNMAGQEGIPFVAEASHRDDLGERRPGMKALEELGIRSPLLEAGFTKSGIREQSRRFGLAGSDRLSSPCLATRIPYGSSVTAEKLSRVSAAERFLAGLGFKAPRVRDYGSTARIELREGGVERVADRVLRDRIVAALRDLGYVYVTIDLAGYRSGSMDEVL